MKTLLVLCSWLVTTAVAAQEKAVENSNATETLPPVSGPAPESKEPVQRVYIRDLPADVLRDFPGMCFASTQCAVKNVGEQWPLLPFCGQATCIVSEGGFLVERVQDCGPLPVKNDKCKVVNLNDTAEPFPFCCPQFECEEGVVLEYPVLEELAAGEGVPPVSETPAPAETESTSPIPPPEAVTTEGSTTESSASA